MDLPPELIENTLKYLSLSELLDFRLSTKTHRNIVDGILRRRYGGQPESNSIAIDIVIAKLKKSYVNLTSDIGKIRRDFGHFERSIPYNQFGYFIKRNHVVCIYWSHGEWAIQCQIKTCPGFGWKSAKCPKLHGITLYDNKASNLITSLLDHGFKYQMIYNEFGINTYFDFDAPKTDGVLVAKRDNLRHSWDYV